MIPTRELFSQHSLRCTRQRQALYEALHACKSHPTAEELFHMVRAQSKRLSLATVYNTLEALCNAGLAKKLPLTNGSCRYDADTSDHLHLRLRDTAEIRDVPADLGRRLIEDLPADVLEQIEEQLGVRIEGVNIQLTGSRRAEQGDAG